MVRWQSWLEWDGAKSTADCYLRLSVLSLPAVGRTGGAFGADRAGQMTKKFSRHGRQRSGRDRVADRKAEGRAEGIEDPETLRHKGLK